MFPGASFICEEAVEDLAWDSDRNILKETIQMAGDIRSSSSESIRLRSSERPTE